MRRLPLGSYRILGSSWSVGICRLRVRTQLVTLDGVLVWVNPIHEGGTAPILTRCYARSRRAGWVSAHPDVILKMGTKEVLHRTRTMSWGCDTALYRTVEAMRAEMPARLAAGPQRRPGRLEGRDAGKSAQPANGTRA